jgi:hypothetical protein
MIKIRIPVLVFLFTTAAALEAVRLPSLAAPASSDVWWHLSSGLWMRQNHALPRTGILSQAGDTAWIASSWLYDLLLALAYKIVALRAIPLLIMAFKAALAIVTFLLAGGLSRNFWPAVALSAIAQFILAAVPPGPEYLSVLLFAIELLLLFESRRRQDFRLLVWVPLLMLLWANIDPQFVIGMAVLFLFLVSLLCEQYLCCRKSSLAIGGAARIVGLSVICTVLTPYLYRPYGVFFGVTFSSANDYLMNFHAPGFRQPQDYVLLLLAMAAFLALGLRRSRDLFRIALLASCMAAAFYSRTYAWLITLAAVVVIGDALGEISEPYLGKNWRRQGYIAFACSCALLLAVGWMRLPRTEQGLLARIGQGYPVAACDAIRDQHLAQPLFNAYEWGGFVTWYLPQYPVAIDGRNDLYGAAAITEYSRMMNAQLRYTEYSPVTGAQTILLPRRAVMAGALSSLPIFRIAYSDDLAVVLSRISDE